MLMYCQKHKIKLIYTVVIDCVSPVCDRITYKNKIYHVKSEPSKMYISGIKDLSLVPLMLNQMHIDYTHIHPILITAQAKLLFTPTIHLPNHHQEIYNHHFYFKHHQNVIYVYHSGLIVFVMDDINDIVTTHNILYSQMNIPIILNAMFSHRHYWFYYLPYDLYQVILNML